MKPGEKAREPRPIPVPRAARELLRRVDPTRAAWAVHPAHRFSLDGEDWIARAAGEATAGTGACASGVLAAIHFFRAAAPDLPVREALLPHGRLENLYEEELRAAFLSARPLEPPGEPPSEPPSEKRS